MPASALSPPRCASSPRPVWQNGCRPPGSRRDHFRLCENAWANQYTNQNQVTNAVLTAAREGMAATSPDELAHHRLAQMHAFYTFLMDEIPALLERWHEQSPPS